MTLQIIRLVSTVEHFKYKMIYKQWHCDIQSLQGSQQSYFTYFSLPANAITSEQTAL